MRCSLLLLVAGAAVALAQAATAAPVVITPATAVSPQVFTVSGNPFTGTDPVGATIGDAPNVGGTPDAPVQFTDDFRFTIGPATPPLGGSLIGTGSGSLATSTSVLFSATDLDFLSILVNGTPIDITRTGGTTADGLDEFTGTVSGVPIYSGQQNDIIVTGLSRGMAATFGGNLSFIPSAVPEPASWAMMLLGFGGIGMALRRRRNPALLQLA